MEPHELERLRLKGDVFKAMRHPFRFGILDVSGDSERCVREIVECVGTDMSNISHH